MYVSIYYVIVVIHDRKLLNIPVKQILYVVNDDGTLPLEARFYDRRSELARVMRFSEVREMDGRRIPTVTTIEPVDREGHRTEMRYLSIDFDADVPECTFSLTALERGR